MEAQTPEVVALKPVIYADTRSDAEKYDPRLHQGSIDPGRVPGYSEIVQANDIDKADALTFREQNLGRTKEDVWRQIGATPEVLPIELKWLRISGPGGSDSHTALRELDRYKTKEGFSLCSKEDLERHGYGFPPAAHPGENGMIRRGPDVALYIRDGEVARNWEKFYVEETLRMEGAQINSEFKTGGYSVETFASEESELEFHTH